MQHTINIGTQQGLQVAPFAFDDGTALADPGTVLGGFSPRIVSEAAPGRTLRFMSANNWAKTFYGPLVGRPVSFARGLRCLFGDQAMFCRRADFWRSGGFDEDLPLMEDADLCLRMHMSGPRPGAAGAGAVGGGARLRATMASELSPGART